MIGLNFFPELSNSEWQQFFIPYRIFLELNYAENDRSIRIFTAIKTQYAKLKSNLIAHGFRIRYSTCKYQLLRKTLLKIAICFEKLDSKHVN